MNHDPAIVEARRKLKERDLRRAVALYEHRIMELSDQLAASASGRPRRNTYAQRFFWVLTSLLIVVVVVLAAFVFLVDNDGETTNAPTAENATAQAVVQAQATLAWLEAQEQIYVSSALETYCSSVAGRTKGDCRRWADTIINADYEWCKFCYDEYDWIRDRNNFSICLLAKGFAVLGEEAQVTPLDVAGQTPEDIRITANLSVYCGDTHSEDYCLVWSILTYMKRTEEVRQCDERSTFCCPSSILISEFFNCLSRRGIKPDEV